MKKSDYNPMAEKWQKKIANLTKEQRGLIDKASECGENLQVLKRTRGDKHDGDIFVCTLNGKVYYYGKILRAKVNSLSDWERQCLVVVIFREKTAEKNSDNFKGDYENLLVEPSFVTSQYWSRGFFETIGNFPPTKADLKFDYGFWSGRGLATVGDDGKKKWIYPPNKYYNADGQILRRQPKHIGYGIKTLSGIYSAIYAETVIDPTLLEVD